MHPMNGSGKDGATDPMTEDMGTPTNHAASAGVRLAATSNAEPSIAGSTIVAPTDASRALPPDLAAIQSRFIAARGYWRPWTEALLHANPAFLSRYADYAGYPARTGPLTPRMVELIYVALDASATHLYEAGLATHLDLARKGGASEADIFDVLHLVTCQGMTAVLQAADLLHEAAASTPRMHEATASTPRMHETAASTPQMHEAAASKPLPPGHPLHERIAALWPDQTQRLLQLAAQDPGYVTVMLDFIEGGRPNGGLTDAERLLVRIALHACFTDRDEHTLRALIPHALLRGTPSAEILQAIQLGAHLAVHGAAMGATVYAKRLVGGAGTT